jgi:hypothetical protein
VELLWTLKKASRIILRCLSPEGFAEIAGRRWIISMFKIPAYVRLLYFTISAHVSLWVQRGRAHASGRNATHSPARPSERKEISAREPRAQEKKVGARRSTNLTWRIGGVRRHKLFIRALQIRSGIAHAARFYGRPSRQITKEISSHIVDGLTIWCPLFF